MQDLENLPETAEETQTPETEPSQLKSLASLLAAGENPETDSSDESEEGTAAEKPEKAKPKSLKALAEKLKLEDKDLYAIEVPMANGETRTLGQLKDAVAKQDEFSLREIEFEETRQQREGELIRAQSELRELISSLPKNAIKPEVLEAIHQKHDARLQVERAKTLEAIPAWSDEAKRTEEITGMIEHLESYGFPQNYIQTIHDHRTLKYIRDNYLRAQRVRTALEAVKSGKPPANANSKPNGKAPAKPSSKPRHRDARSNLEAFFSEV